MNRSTHLAAPDTTVVVRLATETDAEALAELRAEFLAEISAPAPAPEGLVPALRGYFRETIPSGRFVAHLALAEGRIIATSGLVFYHCPPSYSNPTGREAYVMNMYTRPEWRGRGVGTRLLKEILNSARQAGCHRVCLDAMPEARALYERMWFVDNDQAMRRLAAPPSS